MSLDNYIFSVHDRRKADFHCFSLCNCFISSLNLWLNSQLRYNRKSELIVPLLQKLRFDCSVGIYLEVTFSPGNIFNSLSSLSLSLSFTKSRKDDSILPISLAEQPVSF